MSKPNPTQACVKDKDICDMTTEEAKSASRAKALSYFKTIYPAEWMLADVRVHCHMTDEILRAADHFFILLDRLESRSHKDIAAHRRQFAKCSLDTDKVDKAILDEHQAMHEKLLNYLDEAKRAIANAIIMFTGTSHEAGSAFYRFATYQYEARKQEQEQAKENNHE